MVIPASISITPAATPTPHHHLTTAAPPLPPAAHHHHPQRHTTIISSPSPPPRHSRTTSTQPPRLGCTWYGRKEHFILPRGRISTAGYECCQETLILPVHVSAAITKVTTVGLKPRFVLLVCLILPIEEDFYCWLLLLGLRGREMITSQLQGKLWLYDEVRTRLCLFCHHQIGEDCWDSRFDETK
ncbi:hypothetical protein Tco_0721920 [Tanacetum coccineum]